VDDFEDVEGPDVEPTPEFIITVSEEQMDLGERDEAEDEEEEEEEEDTILFKFELIELLLFAAQTPLVGAAVATTDMGLTYELLSKDETTTFG
jgi:hypothetical protein